MNEATGMAPMVRASTSLSASTNVKRVSCATGQLEQAEDEVGGGDGDGGGGGGGGRDRLGASQPTST